MALPIEAQGIKPCTDMPWKMPPPPNWAVMHQRQCVSPPETVFDDGMSPLDYLPDAYRHLNGEHDGRESPELLPQVQ